MSRVKNSTVLTQILDFLTRIEDEFPVAPDAEPHSIFLTARGNLAVRIIVPNGFVDWEFTSNDMPQKPKDLIDGLIRKIHDRVGQFEVNAGVSESILGDLVGHQLKAATGHDWSLN